MCRVASSSDNDKDSETDHAIERESPPRWRSLVQIQDATRGDGASVQYLEWQAIVASLLDRLTDFDLHQNQLAPADAEPVD